MRLKILYKVSVRDLECNLYMICSLFAVSYYLLLYTCRFSLCLIYMVIVLICYKRLLFYYEAGEVVEVGEVGEVGEVDEVGEVGEMG